MDEKDLFKRDGGGGNKKYLLDLLDHMFCGLCIRRGSEVQIGDGRTRIICFQEQCDNEIEMQVKTFIFGSNSSVNSF